MNTATRIVRKIINEEEETNLDHALTFIEEEIGRYDWVENWAIYKGKYDAIAQIRGWLARTNSVGNAHEIFRYIEELVKRGGKYK